MRAVCYLGTRGCPGLLEDALREDLAPLTVLVPVEARLLGPLAETDLADGVPEVAEILVERARQRGVEQARRRIDGQAGVFEPTADAAELLAADTIEAPLEETIPRWLDERGAQRLFLSRDGLDVLAEAGVELAASLDRAGLDLVTR